MRERAQEDPLELKGARLSLKSIVLISAVIGFCGTLIFVPFLVLFSGSLNFSLLVFFMAPFIGALNGAFAGLMGYPVYYFLINRYFSLGLTGFIQRKHIG